MQDLDYNHVHQSFEFEILSPPFVKETTSVQCAKGKIWTQQSK
jgi:hypothetical protein